MELPASPNLTPAWTDIRTALRGAVGESVFDVWLAPLEPLQWDGTVLVLAAPPSTQRWVAERFGRVLNSCAEAVLRTSVRVAFAAATQGGGVPTTLAAPSRTAHLPQLASAATGLDPLTRASNPLIPRYTFEQFIIGRGNRLAHAAALAVAEAPGQTYNPLFLHAPPGLGKTHLLHAIGNYINAFEPSLTVRYTTVEAFTNSFITALGSRDLDHFKHTYRDADVLLIDDVQFLASKAKTEEELFHTFNAVYDRGHQLVLTCDRLPRKLVGVEKRLCERFEAGLVAQLELPDRATRVAILRKRAALDHVHVPDPAVLELIADRVTDNIRSLEGALIRLVAHHSLTGRPLELPLARDVLDEMYPLADSASVLSVEQIQKVVARHFGLAVEDLVSSSRVAEVAWPRQLAIDLCHELTAEPLKAIGCAFGGRNHATVLHACKRVRERTAVSRDDEASLRELRRLLA